jgi:phosphonopyruvate decarboxylase
MLIPARAFIEALTSSGVSFFAGVPDSLLAAFCAEVAAPGAAWMHRIAANEGAAVALASGHHLVSGKPAAVYMQNSGLGNAINSLTSLADPLVYGFPLILVIGWRAELREGKQLADEPQHIRQGLITPALLDVLSIPFVVLGSEPCEGLDAVGPLVDRAVMEERPVAIVVRKGALSYLTPEAPFVMPRGLAREQAIAFLAQAIGADIPIIATTGKISRELFEIRKRNDACGDLDFLTVGSMGHASQIATGVAITRPGNPVICFDGDGAALMHLGGLTVSATCPNLRHVIFNNRVHDSVGGQPTCAPDAFLAEIAKACGYGWARRVTDRIGLEAAMPAFLGSPRSALLEVIVQPGARANLGRPDRSPHAQKEMFMARLSRANHGR